MQNVSSQFRTNNLLQKSSDVWGRWKFKKKTSASKHYSD